VSSLVSFRGLSKVCIANGNGIPDLRQMRREQVGKCCSSPSEFSPLPTCDDCAPYFALQPSLAQRAGNNDASVTRAFHTIQSVIVIRREDNFNRCLSPRFANTRRAPGRLRRNISQTSRLKRDAKQTLRQPIPISTSPNQPPAARLLMSQR